jgi:signal peptidase I
MFPSLKNGDYLLVDQKYYSSPKHAIERGDIVICRRPLANEQLLIKRVIGLPNEYIELLSNGSIFINGQYYKENYLPDEGFKIIPWCWELSDAEYVLLGDNRSDSFDSRKFGPIYYEQICGRAWLRLFPLKLL